MKCRNIQNNIDDYLSGQQPVRQRTEFEHHLAGCEACRTFLREVRTIKSLADQVRDDALPERDLWPDIRVNLETKEKQTSFFMSRYFLITAPAAALCLILFFMIPGFRSVLIPDTGGANLMLNASYEPRQDIMERFTRLEKEYAELSMMFRDTDRKKHVADPEMLKIIEENLSTIEKAIENIRQVIMENPGNEDVYIRLLDLEEQKLKILKNAHKLLL